jgi:hypothetical protein
MNEWRPILTGSLAERVWQSVEEITAAIDPEAPPQDDPAAGYPGLAGGSAGQALFFAYRSRSSRATPRDTEAATTLLDRSTEALAETPLPPDLYGGFSGVAWAAEHLYGPRFADPEENADGSGEAAAGAGPSAAGATPGPEPGAAGDEDDPLIDIDEALVRYLERTPWTADYDLIRGLTGLGVYALERLPRRSALTCLAKVLDRLGETAERDARGTTWHTSPELLPDWQRALFPSGYYNLGVAHGVPGTIAMLGGAFAGTAPLAAAGDPLAREVSERARTLVEESVRWLLAQRLPPEEGSWFGSSFSPEVKATRSRLAWCYGDPGISAALLVAARTCGEPAWERSAVELALACAARDEEASVKDAGLCHGAAGLGHLFNRLYQQTGEEKLAAASRLWFERALAFRAPGEGLAGYRAFWIGDDGATQSWRNDPGFLEGIAGIGLALLGAVSDFAPAWDRILALSVASDPRG